METKLKLLAGELAGAEYALAAGDTVFVVGPRQDLLSGHVAQTLADVENLYFVPGIASMRFVVRRSPDGKDVLLGLPDAEGAWRFEPIVAQQAHRAGDLWFAVRVGDQAWSADVLAFEPPRALPAVVPTPSVASPVTSPAPVRKSLSFGLLLLAAVVLGLFAWNRAGSPAEQVTTLETTLRNGPVDFAITFGRDERLHAFADSAEGVAWGQRAVERLGKGGAAVFTERSREVERIGQKLSDAGLDFVVVRLRDPARPEIVMSVTEDGAPVDTRRIRALLLPTMPYAQELDISTVSDQRLVSMVRDDLRSRGIPSNVHASADRVAISNDIALDDAALHAMAAYRNVFVSQWGDRRLSINIALWDDLLKGSSFHYTPAKLLTMGGGVWNLSNATQDRPTGLEESP